jgi:hypothetical protein
MSSLDDLDDSIAAAAFRRLVRHLRHRDDAQNIDLMGLAGFCRNCLSDWVEEASADVPGDALDKEGARDTACPMRSGRRSTRSRRLPNSSLAWRKASRRMDAGKRRR